MHDPWPAGYNADFEVARLRTRIEALEAELKNVKFVKDANVDAKVTMMDLHERAMEKIQDKEYEIAQLNGVIRGQRQEVERLRVQVAYLEGALETCPVERLRAELNLLKMGPAGSAFALEAEVERLRANIDIWQKTAEDALDEAGRLRAQVGRLRKAVTWLTGALSDDPEFDWERERSRVVLDETTSEGREPRKPYGTRDSLGR